MARRKSAPKAAARRKQSSSPLSSPDPAPELTPPTEAAAEESTTIQDDAGAGAGDDIPPEGVPEISIDGAEPDSTLDMDAIMPAENDFAPAGDVMMEAVEGLEQVDGLETLEGLEGLQEIQAMQGMEGMEGIDGIDGMQGMEGMGDVQGLEEMGEDDIGMLDDAAMLQLQAELGLDFSQEGQEVDTGEVEEYDGDGDGDVTLNGEELDEGEDDAGDDSLAIHDGDTEDADTDDSDNEDTNPKQNNHSTSFIYPAAVPDFTSLSSRETSFKVARFLACQVEGCDCKGLLPPRDAIVRLASRDELDEEGNLVDPEEPMQGRDRTREGWWRLCGGCGHGWEKGTGHVWAQDVGETERFRRGKVMGRIEELLQVSLLAALSCRCADIQDEDLIHVFPTRKIESAAGCYEQLESFRRPAGGKRPAGPLPSALDISTPYSGTGTGDGDGDGDGEDDGEGNGGDNDAENPDGEGDDRPLKRQRAESPQTGKRPGKTSGKERMPRTVVRGARGLVAMETEPDGTQHPGGHLPDSVNEGDEDAEVPLAQRPQLEEGERKRRELIKEKERKREEQLVRGKDVDVDVWEGVELVSLAY